MEFIDLKAQYAVLKDDINNRINNVLESSHFILGGEVAEFERKLAEFVGVKHVIGCSDGTSALELAYMAYGIGAGDAVFCPDMTFIASIEPAALLGATPVFCDIDSKSYNICPKSLERQIKAVIEEGKLVPKAVVAVDFVGNPADYDAIRPICDKYNLLLIEDAAQGMGAMYKGRRCGSFGDIATTSFFPSKPLGGYGDGGAVFTNDDEIASVIRSLRVHGKGVDKYHNVRLGLNSRLDTVQAAILLAKLDAFEGEIEKRQDVAKKYYDALEGRYITPYIEATSVSSYAQFIIRSKNEGERDNIVDKLKAQDIPVILYYPVPMHMLPVFEGVETYGETYTNTVKYSNEHLGIPFSPYISDEDQRKVIDALLM